MKNLSILLLNLSCVSFLSLNGCTGILHTCQQKENLRQQCLQSHILITDLTKRHPESFQLPDGRACPNPKRVSIV